MRSPPGVVVVVVVFCAVPKVEGSTVLSDRASLLGARDAWCTDPTAAAGTYGDIAAWDVSAIEDFSFLFCACNTSLSSYYADCNLACSTFNGNITNWDTSSATNMRHMFTSASSFNQPLTNFNTSRVGNMRFMFDSASSFNQPLTTFDTSRVANMEYMFHHASSFNQPLFVDTSSVTRMNYMFDYASSFNQPLTNFDTSSVTNMKSMFSYASSFNQLLFLDTSSVTHMNSMFNQASSFNQPLNFDVSSAPEMTEMFAGTVALSDCNKALIHAAFSANANWGIPGDAIWGTPTGTGDGWGDLQCSSPPPSSPPPPLVSPLPSPSPSASQDTTKLAELTVETGGLVQVNAGGVLTIG